MLSYYNNKKGKKKILSINSVRNSKIYMEKTIKHSWRGVSRHEQMERHTMFPGSKIQYHKDISSPKISYFINLMQ
jgi:hypothetical protein